ncbi:hypothetical protein [Paenibacillus arenosi]|uniref:Fibronectin type-III domain-containing protein n=1 Tax=Paenibacillus arenosi TaxID=2774142 RepID=A0ABR9ARS4_9BACL|nr:hypothetical protein [Paenibacillus arenosi]MBD8496817.1 hypothetical protein [Paenibacillus arenosi]
MRKKFSVLSLVLVLCFMVFGQVASANTTVATWNTNLYPGESIQTASFYVTGNYINVTFEAQHYYSSRNAKKIPDVNYTLYKKGATPAQDKKVGSSYSFHWYQLESHEPHHTTFRNLEPNQTYYLVVAKRTTGLDDGAHVKGKVSF